MSLLPIWNQWLHRAVRDFEADYHWQANECWPASCQASYLDDSRDLALGAVDKRCLEDIFQLLFAGAQSRLRDVTRLRRPAKVAVIGKQDEMLELAKSRQVYHRFWK